MVELRRWASYVALMDRGQGADFELHTVPAWHFARDKISGNPTCTHNPS